MGIAAVGVAILIVATALGLGRPSAWVLGPLGLAAIGAAFIWREADDARRARWRRTAAGIVGPSRASWWRLIGGCVLVVGGLSVFALGQLDFTAVRSALLAVVLTLVGVAVITIPWWLRLVRDLGDERRGRVRERERAEIAAHLHDSVLQTLALIQRQAGDGREVQRLARSQERQLRTWLYGPAGYAARPRSPIPRRRSTRPSPPAWPRRPARSRTPTTSRVTPVIVGDAGMDQHLNALVAAAREAMVNAAKHAQVEEISVYAEVEDGTASVFVRDRGVGFDPAVVGSDRRGLAESIRGRMERHGGTATVRSSPGNGTEIELTVPVTQRRPAASPSPSRRRYRESPSIGRMPSMSQPVTVFLVDDHALFRTGVKAELAGLGDDRIDVVGEAGSVGEAVVRITSDPPDVVLLDVHMPDGGGRAVLEQVHAKLPDVVFLALSVSDAAEDVIAVIRAGARGYVTKTISGRELADAVVRVSAGDAVFSPRLAGFVLDAFSDRGGPAPVTDPELDLLSPARARGAQAAGPRVRLQGDRRAAVHLDQDGGDARVQRAAQDPEVEPLRAVPLGLRPPAGLSRAAYLRPSLPRPIASSIMPRSVPAGPSARKRSSTAISRL